MGERIRVLLTEEEVDQHGMVGGQGALRETLAGEDDQTDLVVGSL